MRCGQVPKYPTTDDLALGCLPTALVIGESKAPAAELLLEHAVFFDEVADGLGLVAVHPASEVARRS